MVQAVKFTFPHRAGELNRYFEYISSIFMQSEESSHGQIIHLDKAIRTRVGSSCRYELSDITAFTNLHYAHFMSGGRHHADTSDSRTGSKTCDSSGNSK